MPASGQLVTFRRLCSSRSFGRVTTSPQIHLGKGAPDRLQGEIPDEHDREKHD